MVHIEASREINAPLSKVWNIASNLDDEPKYWHGTKSVRNISVEGNNIRREVVIAFRNSKCMETVVLTPLNSIEVIITDGPIKGTKTISLNDLNNKTNVKVVWEIKLSGMMSVFSSMLKGHIERGTEDALERISLEAKKER